MLDFVKYSTADLLDVFKKMEFVASASPIFDAPEHIKWSILKPVTDEALVVEHRKSLLISSTAET